MIASKRLAARFKGAFEHPSEEARKEYLKSHPKADPKNHTVKGEGGKGKKPEDEAGAPPAKGEKPVKPGKPQPEDAPEQAPAKGEKPEAKPTPGREEGGEGDPAEKPSKTKSFFKGLSDKAKAFVTKSSANVQKFVSDTEHRAKVLEDAGKSVMTSPKTYAKRIVHTVKEEVHEFKEAGHALKSLAAGKKLDHHQKKALKTVAIHMSIAIVAAALTSTGLLTGAAAFGKGMVQKVALKAAAHSLENVHLVQEIHHIGHGAGHLMHLIAAEQLEEQEQGSELGEAEEVEPEQDASDDAEAEDDSGEGEEGDPSSPEEAFAFLIMQSVVQTLEGLDDATMAEILEESAGDQEKMAFKIGAATDSSLPALLGQGQDLFQTILGWISRFDSVLVASRSDSDGINGRVLQRRFVPYFKDGEDTLEEIRSLDQTLDDLFLDVPALAQLVNQARQALRIPRQAEIAYAISDIDFTPVEGGRDAITYSPDVLREWAGTVKAWATKGASQLKTLENKAERLSQVRILPV